MEARRPGKLEQFLALLTALIAVWVMIPDHERKHLQMRLTASAHRAAARLAYVQGHEGMTDELAGRGQASQYYTAAYRLSLRDTLGRRLDRMRP